ncbi:hypothetical protein JK358_31525 [Nocardia sp. 2]|uniref:Uncharacterized protein n=1 Tax=Nocardia acididurans TaxID=2802282 RepID=A0ABS1MEF4_9NOCA|nr:hypothetical protein [Nocardia acididurans]MBL1078944.1 hypothetical protein [Nocardia acididurans]
MRRGNPWGSVLAYGSASAAAVVMIGAGAGLAVYFRTHLGAPPPIIVVAQALPAASTTLVPTTRTTTTTVKPVVPQEDIPPQLPDHRAYTAAPVTALPGFVNRTANHYGWFGGDGVSARCDEWQRATVVGSTSGVLFVVCGSYFKGYDLATATPIRVGVAGGGGGWSGSGADVSIRLTETELIIGRESADPAVQEIVQWWMP